MTQALLAGAAERAITPPIGVELTGFVARLGASNAIHDDLMARALVFEHEGIRFAILTLDLIGLEADLADEIRRRVAASVGVPPHQVMLACSHTHSGPATLRLIGCGTWDPVWIASLPARLAAIARAAAASMRPARIGVATADLSAKRLSKNRCVPDGPLDPMLGVAWLDGLDGQPIATLVSFACHTVVLGPENRAISGDWAGALARQVSAKRECPTLFLNGACGDVNPTRRGSFEIAEEMGARLASCALALIGSPGEGYVALRAYWQDYRVALDNPPTLDDLLGVLRENEANVPWPPQPNDAVRQRIAAAMRQWVEQTRLTILSGQAERALAAPLQVFWIGDLAIMAVPGELFSRLGLEIKEAISPRVAFVATYANGSVGYIPTPEAYVLHGYETHAAYRYYGYPSALAPQAGEALRDAAIALLAKGGDIRR